MVWRRECINPSLPKFPVDSEARAISKNTPFFKHEPFEIELTIKIHGIDAAFTRKAHYELAGRGVESSWGVSKIHFCSMNSKLTNDER